MLLSGNMESKETGKMAGIVEGQIKDFISSNPTEARDSFAQIVQDVLTTPPEAFEMLIDQEFQSQAQVAAENVLETPINFGAGVEMQGKDIWTGKYAFAVLGTDGKLLAVGSTHDEKQFIPAAIVKTLAVTLLRKNGRQGGISDNGNWDWLVNLGFVNTNKKPLHDGVTYDPIIISDGREIIVATSACMPKEDAGKVLTGADFDPGEWSRSAAWDRTFAGYLGHAYLEKMAKLEIPQNYIKRQMAEN